MQAGEISYRFAAPADLKRVVAAYWQCFNAEQRFRTVAHSPFLFRFFYGREMKAGRCRVAVAEAAGEMVGFAIVRENGESAPWLLSAIGVLPSARRGGVARKLFEMVATQPLTLTVEQAGPVAFYESLGCVRTGEETVVYVRRAGLPELLQIAAETKSAAPPTLVRRVHFSAWVVTAPDITGAVAKAVAARTRLGRTCVLIVPKRVDLATNAGLTVIHEIAFARARA